MSGRRRLRMSERTRAMAWETQAIGRRGPSPENPHPNTAIFGRER
jgi:hypothetical protein